MIGRKLILEVIWKDDDMFELQITASNGSFCGVTRVYEVPDSLLSFVYELKGFPFGKSSLMYNCGEKSGRSYFGMRFYKIGETGVCGVQLTLESDVFNEHREEEKDRLTMELIVEPAAIDIFYKELKSMVINQKGVAELVGIEKRISNIL